MVPRQAACALVPAGLWLALPLAACTPASGDGETDSTTTASSTPASTTTTESDAAPTSTSESTTSANTTSANTTSANTTSASTSTTDDSSTTDSTGHTYPIDAICAPWPAPANPFDQSVVPIEVPPNDPAATKIVLVAGAPSLDHPPGAHEFFAGSAILAKLLCQTPGVTPVLVKNGWPTDETIFAGASSIVFYLDGRDTHPLADPAKYAALKPHIEAGAGFVNLHYAVDYNPPVGAQILPWLGGYYEAGYSVNPIWKATYAALPAHPIANGVPAFTVNDEWYYDMRWIDGMVGVTSILQSVPPRRPAPPPTPRPTRAARRPPPGPSTARTAAAASASPAATGTATGPTASTPPTPRSCAASSSTASSGPPGSRYRSTAHPWTSTRPTAATGSTPSDPGRRRLVPHTRISG
ncbi:MAG: ThuA domain-containing protein [Nannocystis sp.]|uniref:ThuA domain-containing protein n=1 Tax=Nannocystis sp. TaxID=1962667 RepID=UPI002420CEF9|nr:ThuA domain-containing protein [Nannocystis sp.]MBK9755490.1 ThuA domain-containing protein [Nannocystis sp.]